MGLAVFMVSAPLQGSHVLYSYLIPGNEYFDTVTISPGVEIRQSIGVALNSSGFNPYDGIFG
jgi:hypothetical protein